LKNWPSNQKGASAPIPKNLKGRIDMKAILIKYLAATDSRGSYLKATSDSGSMTEPRDYDIGPGNQAERLAHEYCAATWDGCEVTGVGELPNGDYCATIKSINY
jgi:hypothetical protein